MNSISQRRSGIHFQCELLRCGRVQRCWEKINFMVQRLTMGVRTLELTWYVTNNTHFKIWYDMMLIYTGEFYTHTPNHPPACFILAARRLLYCHVICKWCHPVIKVIVMATSSRETPTGDFIVQWMVTRVCLFPQTSEPSIMMVKNLLRHLTEIFTTPTV